MKFPKLRFTLGNVASLFGATTAFIANHEAIITAIANSTSGKVAAAAVIGLAVSKAAVTTNHDQIPANNKLQAGPIVVERTGPLKSDTPSSN